MRKSSGQGSLEYVAVLALVAALLVLGTAAADGLAVGRRVTREMARALCIVTGGDCAHDREACVIATDGRRRGSHVNLLVLRLGGDTTVLLEELSDGTVAVTRAPRNLVGLEVGVGADAGIHMGSFDVAVGGELRAAVLAHLGGGRTWIMPSRRAAEDLVERLRTDGAAQRRPRRGITPTRPSLPAPDVTYDGHDVAATLTAALTASGGVDLGAAEAAASLARRAGVRVDHRTGRRTVYLSTSATASATLSAAGGLLGSSAEAGTAGEVFALELAGDGRPVALSVLAAGHYGGSRDLPAVVAPIAGRLAVRTGGDRTYEVTVRLDLSSPANLAAARAMLAQVASTDPLPRDLVAASAALRRRLEDAGTIEARVLAESRDRSGFEIHGAGGVKVGGGWERETWSARLLAAASRGLDGQWLAREDCVLTSAA